MWAATIKTFSYCNYLTLGMPVLRGQIFKNNYADIEALNYAQKLCGEAKICEKYMR